MTQEQAKQHIEKIRLDKFGLSPDGGKQMNPLERDLRAALKSLAEELSAKETHFILELLQNAEDNTYPPGAEPELCLSVEVGDPTESGGEGCLCLLNNEVGFTPEQVLSLCSIGQSTKDKRGGYIGEKGIGFKSVFRVSDQPHIFSNGYQFRFQKPRGSNELGYIEPHWVDSTPSIVRPGFTAILLPLVAGKRAGIAEKLRAVPPETILFLKQLRWLGIGEGHFVARDKTSGVVKLSADSDEALYFVHRQLWPRPGDLVEEKRVGINEREVTVALPLRSSRPAGGRVFAFLPTELDTGLPFLVNADFLLSASRDSLLDDRCWNEWLRDRIAPTFVKAFLLLANDPAWRTEAYRFLPIKSDLLATAEFFAPVIEAAQNGLREQACVLSATGDLVLPSQVYFAEPLARHLLADAPPKLVNFRLTHPALEDYRKRLEPLGTQVLTIAQLLDICDDAEWLHGRKAEWWVALLDLLSRQDVSAQSVASFPLLRCRDGICRRPGDGVFFHAEGQPTPSPVPAGWPAAHLFDADLQRRLQQKPEVCGWLIRVAGMRPFSVQSYITGSLLDWMRGQTGERTIEATRFIAANLKHLDPKARQTLAEKMTWLVADGRVLLPEQRAGKELVTPECLEGEIGWNLLFPALDRHFFVVHDAYCDGLPEETLLGLRGLFKACAVTAFPAPRLRELNAGGIHYNEALARCAHAVVGAPRLRDWAAPGWLLGFGSVEQTVNGQRKVGALQRWLKERGPDDVKKLLYCSKPDYEGDWQKIAAWSEFGSTLHAKAWLRTSKGFMPPSASFLDTPEFREFFGDSVPYVVADISPQLLEQLGVRSHLTAEVLISLLRQLSGTENPDFALLVKIYRRLQDATLDARVFHREKLIFLSVPEPRWRQTEEVVWEDAGALFDDDFGYVDLTYGPSELRHFFTEKLKVPTQPELKHYAAAWQSLCSATAQSRAVVERKLKIILQHLADSEDKLPNCNWWRDLNPHLRIWTDSGHFEPPAQVYVPDDSVAVELFRGHIHVAFAPKPNPAVLGFLKRLGCHSLSSNVQARLAQTSGESRGSVASFLTPAAKELCVFLVCSHHGWQARRSLLQALLETDEVGVTAITLEYSLHDNPDAGARSQPCDAHWDFVSRRLLLRDGVDLESLRDAAAKSLAVAFFGEAESSEMQSEFFRLLTVSVERAKKLLHERSKWHLTLEQQEWLRERNWETVITKLDEVEPPPTTRRPRGPAAPTSSVIPAAPPVAATPPADSADHGVPTPHDIGSPATHVDQVGSGRGKSETPRPETATPGYGHKPQTKSTSGASADLQDASSTTADFVSVRGYTRSRPQSRAPHQEQENRREPGGGLSTTSADDKAALEQYGRAVAERKLKEMHYAVTRMGQRSPGYDLLAVKPGDTLKVEVKAHAGEASRVFVTQREWGEYLKTCGGSGEAWELWNVENLAKASGKGRTIQRVRHIPKSAMKESGYWIDLNQCSQESPKSRRAEPQ